MDTKSLGADLARYHRMRRDLKTLILEIRAEDLPFPLDQADADKITGAVEMITILIGQAEREICVMIDENENWEEEDPAASEYLDPNANK